MISPSEPLGATLLDLRRYPEAREVFDRGLALAPANLASFKERSPRSSRKATSTGARAVLETVLREVEPSALVAFMATTRISSGSSTKSSVSCSCG